MSKLNLTSDQPNPESAMFVLLSLFEMSAICRQAGAAAWRVAVPTGADNDGAPPGVPVS